MQQRGLSARTVRFTHAVMRSALHQAVKWRLIRQNPCESVDLPKQAKGEIQVLNPQQARDFMKEAAEDRYHVLFALALAIGKLSDPPQVSDLQGFLFDSQDIKELKDCKPDKCEIQLPASGIEGYRKCVDFSAPDAQDKANEFLHKAVIERLVGYQKGGNQVLGEYNDKKNPTKVSEQFKYMLSYNQVLPKVLPDFYTYLLTYPNGKPATVQDIFYWDKVKFGLKPTLRVVQVVTMQGNKPHEPAYTIAEKQLYSSHYFETALDLTFCIRSEDQAQPGFYLIMVMGSEQAGLTGFKGSIVRKVATGKSASNLQKSLETIKNVLEQNQ